MKNLIKYGLLLVVGILGYNYFYGTPAEKEQSQKIFSEFKDVGESVVGLVKDEKVKYDEGKYDEAIDKMKVAVEKMKDRIDRSGDDSLKDEMEDLGDRSREILEKWERNKPKNDREKRRFEEDMRDLMDEAENVFGN